MRNWRGWRRIFNGFNLFSSNQSTDLQKLIEIIMNRYLLKEGLEELVETRLSKYLHETERSDDLAENWYLARASYLLAKLYKDASNEHCLESLEFSRNHLNLAGMILTNSIAYLSDEELEKAVPSRRRLAKRIMRYINKIKRIKSEIPPAI